MRSRNLAILASIATLGLAAAPVAAVAATTHPAPSARHADRSRDIRGARHADRTPDRHSLDRSADKRDR
jgi:hypothetical protein